MPRGVKECSNCRSRTIVRIDKYDAIACAKCKIWLEKDCLDPKCEFCSVRPRSAESVNWDDPRNTVY
jgi:transcription initiation factor TFIIIB Brf1 subunit/transcription initiation factor TFIIB